MWFLQASTDTRPDVIQDLASTSLLARISGSSLPTTRSALQLVPVGWRSGSGQAMCAIRKMRHEVWRMPKFIKVRGLRLLLY